MEERMLVGLVALALSFACVYASAFVLATAFRRRRAALSAQGERSTLEGMVAWRLRNGFSPLLPLARKLLALKRVDELSSDLVSACADRGWQASRESVLSVLAALLLLAFVVTGFLSGGVIAACAVDVCAVAVLVVAMGGLRDKRRDAVREEVPNALESMAACFGSGFTLLQTLEQVSHEVPGRLGEAFGKGAHVLETGGSAQQALQALREGAGTSELAFVSVALDVQHENGGTLRQVLDAASDSVKGELALRRSLRVQTAQAKLSARVVVVMPFVLIAAFSLASPDFLSPFFSSVAGYALLGLAAIMQVAGIVLVRRALSVDGVS